MRFIASQCRVCGRPATAKFEDHRLTPEEMETTQIAVDKFLPLLTCNPCYDAHDARNRSGKTIAETCWSLEISANLRQFETIKVSARRALESALPVYAKAIAYQASCPVIVYHESAVDRLMEHPDKCAHILKEWRTYVWQQAKKLNSENTERAAGMAVKQ